MLGKHSTMNTPTENRCNRLSVGPVASSIPGDATMAGSPREHNWPHSLGGSEGPLFSITQCDARQRRRLLADVTHWAVGAFP